VIARQCARHNACENRPATGYNAAAMNTYVQSTDARIGSMLE